MSLTITEHLLRHLDENPGSFYRLWRKPGDTPGRAVAELRDIIEDGVSDLEDDSFFLGDLVRAMLNGIGSEESWELGQGILARKTKYANRYG